MDDDDEGILWLCNYFQHKRKEGSDVGCGNALHSIAKKNQTHFIMQLGHEGRVFHSGYF